MNTEALQYISAMPHFSMLPREELERISSAATFVQYTSGTIYALQGKTEINNIFIISEGALTLFDEKESGKKQVGYIKPGEVFGGITILLNGSISLRSAEVNTHCAGFAVPKKIFLDLTTKYKVFFEYFLENFSKNIYDPSMASLIETGQVRHFLAGIEPFTFLTDEELDQIATEIKAVTYPPDTVLFAQGTSRVGYLYILQKGSAERYYEEGNKRSLRELLGEGNLYGGISILLNDGISVRTVRTREKTVVYLLPKKRFMELCSTNASFSEFFTDIFGKRMLQKSYAALVAKTMVPREENMQFFNQHVASIYTMTPIFGSTSMTIQEAAQTMARHNISALFLNSDEGECVGLVTERDLARRVIARGLKPKHQVHEIMTQPVYTIPEYAQIFEALMTMLQYNIRHLAVTDIENKVIGVLTNRDLLSAQGQSPIFLIRSIADAATIEEVTLGFLRLPKIVRSLISSGAKANNLTQFITTVSDAILQKVMTFTLAEVGPAPVKFAFMIMGSEGRGEQTLKTDQDNALIFEDVEETRRDEVMHYFLRFGELACDKLNRVGYDFCKGNVMAKNPELCQPLSQWKKNFTSWIHAAEAKDLLQASIFFDFKCGYGEKNLVDALRRHLFLSLQGWAGFFWHLAINAQYFKPPLGFFRNFVVESKGEHRDKFDIKSAMMPIVDFARIYALKHMVEETNTLKRLAHLNRIDILNTKEYEELEKAYSFLMQLRLVRQVTAITDEKRSPDNYINPKSLTQIEQRMLKEIFARIENFQKKLEVDFTGVL